MTELKITKETFPELFKELQVKKNKRSIKHKPVRLGNWPFKVNEGTLIKIDTCIFFQCIYKRVIEKTGIFAINGDAITNMKHYKAKELPIYLRVSHNRSSVNDVIKYGLEMEEKK